MKPLFVLMAAAGLLFAADPWNKDPQRWTAKDEQRILNSSPWAQATNASFGQEEADNDPPPPGPLPGAAEAGMAGARAATDGRWDGGVGRVQRSGVPALPVLVRWDSALPVREAASHLATDAPGSAVDVKAATDDQAAHDYVLTLIGLVPAKRYRDAGQLDGSSSSDGASDARNSEEMLEGLMASSRLLRKGGKPIAPENVRLDAATGILHIYFPRTSPITAADREVFFTTQFGALTVRRMFRLADMEYQGRLQL